MVRVAGFFIIQLAVTSFALARGGLPERVAATALLIAAIVGVTLQTPFGHRFEEVEHGVLAVDLVLAMVLLVLALRADRYWTLLLAAMQLLGVGAHVVRFVEPAYARTAYAVLLAGWSYPMLLVVLIGTVRHARRAPPVPGGLQRIVDRSRI